MEDVEAVLKGRVFFMRNLNKALNEGILSDSKGLGNDYVVSIWEKSEGILHKLQTSSLKNLINTKQINDYRIISFVGDDRKLSQLQILHNISIFSKVKHSSVRIFLFFDSSLLLLP